MNIADCIDKAFIITELRSSSKSDVLAELAQTFVGENGGIKSESMVKVLLEREKMGSTGIGDGIAIPHGKMIGIKKMMVGFGRSLKGVDFDSLDGRPVHLLFLLIAPETSSGGHLRTLAKISRMLKDDDFRNNLLKAETDDDLYRIIADMDRRVP